MLHKFSDMFIDKDFVNVTQDFDNALLYNCIWHKLNGVTLKNCDLNHSKIPIQKIEDILNFTVTLNCKSFNNVELSELVFNLFLILLYKTKGNDTKRRKILELIGTEEAKKLLSTLEGIE